MGLPYDDKEVPSAFQHVKRFLVKGKDDFFSRSDRRIENHGVERIIQGQDIIAYADIRLDMIIFRIPL